MKGDGMQVKEIATSRLLWATSEESLRDAAVRLAVDGVGALTVSAGGETVGIFTEHDLVQAVANGVDLDDTPIARYLTAPAVEVEEDAPAEYAVQQMNSYRLRYLVVVRHGKPRGMLSSRDLLRSVE